MKLVALSLCTYILMSVQTLVYLYLMDENTDWDDMECVVLKGS